MDQISYILPRFRFEYIRAFPVILDDVIVLVDRVPKQVNRCGNLERFFIYDLKLHCHTRIDPRKSMLQKCTLYSQSYNVVDPLETWGRKRKMTT